VDTEAGGMTLEDAIKARDLLIAQQAARIETLERERNEFARKFAAARSELADHRAKYWKEYA
jgi:hypothetical protein